MKRELALVAMVVASVACSETTTEEGSDSIVLALDAFDAAPGEEGLKCQTFANPRAKEIDIVAWKSRLARSGHHMLVWVVDDAKDDRLGPCADDKGGSFAPIFQGQEAGEATLEYPAGIATKLGPRQGLGIQIHYLNPGSSPVRIENELHLGVGKEGGARRPVQPLRYENMAIKVPARAPATTITKSCKLPRDIELVTVVGHMHAHGLRFHVASRGETIYETTSSEAPMKRFASPLVLEAQREIAFSCTYASDPNSDIGFGDALQRDEMCVLVGGYVARDGSTPGTIQCEDRAGAGGCLKCIDGLVQRAADKLCPEEKPKLEAVEACTCDPAKCGSACAASACNNARPDDACEACLQQKCAAEQKACVGDAIPNNP